MTNKPPKLLISHKTEDQAYADALRSLIEFIIGANGDTIFCSSLPGYGIKPSQDIIDTIKKQFDEYNLFVVILHSPRYYKSSVCLNEMGAAWALNTKFCSFLTKDCTYDQLSGVIGKEEICINPNDEEEMLNAHLNSFKDEIVSFFCVNQPNETKWEHQRCCFVKTVLGIKDIDLPGEAQNLFDIVYLPSLDTIFEYLDVEHFSEWAFDCAIRQPSLLHESMYEAMHRVILYIKSRPKHVEYASWDSLMKNLGQLLMDFRRVYSYHSEKYEDNGYCYVPQFYKSWHSYGYNPNYDEDVHAYEEYVYLISDLIFEMARLCNLILTRIREIHPEYRQPLGILHVSQQISEPDLVYRKEEISDSPYPGIEAYIAVRLTRETHYGHSGTIGIDGREKTKSDVE